ncbi:MAG TPA: hypothetical protein VK719_02600 [Trebonia sp.]|nr:hypothetical protein [Trebonia sp.]
MDVNELIERYPRLFHLAEADSAPAIVVELAVSGGVRDISNHVIDVYRGVA